MVMKGSGIVEGALRLRLSEAFLTYPAGQEIHTAASGRIAALHEVFLEIEDRDAGITAMGEVRANIAFITGTPNEAVVPAAVALVEDISRKAQSAEDLAMYFSERRQFYPKIAQALVDNTLVDLEAKRAGVPACEILGGTFQDAIPCNECIFWGDDEGMKRNIASYHAAGFTKIKVRVGVGSLESDLRRLAYLCNTYGDTIRLCIDANGAWTADEALHAIAAFARFDLDYVEQPTIAGDWDALNRVAKETGHRIVIDEGLQTDADVEHLCKADGNVAAHLKIAKAGGVRPMVDIGRRLHAAGIGCIAGQMNEGATATAIAVHAAMALDPLVGELYGARGIQDDPCSGVVYGRGQVSVPRAPGIGVTPPDRDRLTTVWGSSSA
ncbi:mandelate racemase/muconate lactonizing enzyme family protein [Roseovarius amoyensis]|uniref:mandelate racemase/muconate lactonizing enzyme family protein n=1 Tax=Roseovarius amoyensis TaxID=2211448 RepID=UPI000DBE173E|nr:mandelate racemase/muconate lactonizing enzyme family protein [Roseovarius amoyensis]